MGYWGTSATGGSLRPDGDRNPDGSEMLWGDSPADRIDSGVSDLITRLRLDLGRFPTVVEVDAAFGDSTEIADAVAGAREAFARDIGREATDGEVAAGLAFSDTEIALDSALRADITVGDTIRWALFRDSVFYSEVDRTVDATVESIEERDAVSSWTGDPYTRVVYVVTLDGTKVDVDRAYASKVLPGDPTVEEINSVRFRSRDL
jgi:hypothetical protein